ARPAPLADVTDEVAYSERVDVGRLPFGMFGSTALLVLASTIITFVADRSLASPLVRQSLRKTNLFTKMLCWGITQIIPPGTWIRKTAISTVIRLRIATIRFQNQSPRRMALLSFRMKKRPGRKSSEQLFNWRTPPLPPLFHPVAGHHVVCADVRASLG